MPAIEGLNILLAPLGAMILILVDYSHNQTADSVQRRLMSLLAGSAGIAMTLEFTHGVLTGRPGEAVHTALYIVNFLFFVFQNLAVAAIPLFLDYAVNHDLARLRKLAVFPAAICATNFIALLVNIATPFYFYITPDNYYARGDGHIVRVLLLYLPLMISAIDFWVCRHILDSRQTLMGALFVLPAIAGGVMDLLADGSRLFWQASSFSFLFGYLFLVKVDSSIDSLTGLYNRRRCQEFFDEIAQAPRRRAYLFILIDLDYFKQINDKFGHHQGDKALRDISAILKNAVRQRDLVARYGGDEFLLVVENYDQPQPIINRILNGAEKFNETRSSPYTLEFSMGYAVFTPDDPRSPTEFMEYVDHLMYENKAQREFWGISRPQGAR